MFFQSFIDSNANLFVFVFSDNGNESDLQSDANDNTSIVPIFNNPTLSKVFLIDRA